VSDPAILTVEDLKVRFQTEDGIVKAVNGVSFDVRRGEVLAVVGESGCGKSVTAMSLMGLTRGPNAEITGRAMLHQTELIGASDDELRKVRGNDMAMIFQDPMSSMNPVYKVGDQIVEQIRWAIRSSSRSRRTATSPTPTPGSRRSSS
jgi:peptide/nickel transport system ATP-binding protein